MSTYNKINEYRQQGDGKLSLGASNSNWTIDNILTLLKYAQSHDLNAHKIADDETINNANPPRTVGAVLVVSNAIHELIDYYDSDPNTKGSLSLEDAIICWAAYMQQHPNFMFGGKNTQTERENAEKYIVTNIYNGWTPTTIENGTIKLKDGRVVKLTKKQLQRIQAGNESIQRWNTIKNDLIGRYNSLNNDMHDTKTESICISRKQLVDIITESVIKTLKNKHIQKN